MKLNTIYNENCLEGMKRIPDESIDLVVTDTPYKIIGGGDSKSRYATSGMLNRSNGNVINGRLFNHNDTSFSTWVPEIYRVLKEATHFYVMVNDKNMHELMDACVESGFQLVNILIWKKNNVTPNKFYMKNCEFILLYRKGGQRWINDMGTKHLLEIDNIRNKNHPTEKPIELMETFILNSSQVGETVLDPFMGAGSTALAAKENNRQYIGFELDEDYHKIANDRIENHTQQTALF